MLEPLLIYERCNMLWIGPALSPVERACVLSVLKQGHPLTLWCYERPEGVPKGVDLADARGVLPEESITRYRTGSVSLFSNWFRYELQRLGHGIWLDTDIYLFKPIRAGEYLLTCWEPGRINSAPLKLPLSSPILPPLLALFEQRAVPYWLSMRPWLAARWRLLRTGKADLSLMPWGVTGPQAITALARDFGLTDLASPPETFHPFSWTEADWIRDPARKVEDRASERTIGVHLWNERIKHFKCLPPPPGSFLMRLQEEGALD